MAVWEDHMRILSACVGLWLLRLVFAVQCSPRASCAYHQRFMCTLPVECMPTFAVCLDRLDGPYVVPQVDYWPIAL